MENLKKTINRFGREYVWQECSENMDTIKLIESNWKRFGHYTMKRKDKANKKLIHLYATRFKVLPK